MRKANADWSIIKGEYLASRTVSLRDLTVKHGVSYSRITKVSAKEGWSKAKELLWDRVEGEVIEEVEGDIKDLLKRHIKVAKFAQSKAVKKLVTITDKELSEQGAIRLLSEGLKAERELYPKQLQVKGSVELEGEGLSEELSEAIYESFRKKLGRKQPSIHRKSRKKKRVKKK